MGTELGWKPAQIPLCFGQANPALQTCYCWVGQSLLHDGAAMSCWPCTLVRVPYCLEESLAPEEDPLCLSSFAPCYLAPCQLEVAVSLETSPAQPPQLQKQCFISHELEQVWIKINCWPRSLFWCHGRCCACCERCLQPC